jgi:hypothetical protein
MGKVKQWAEDTAEKNVDNIIFKLKDGQVDWDTAKSDILKVDNVNMTGINEDNIDEVLDDSCNVQKEESNLDILLNLEEESKRGK